MTSSICENCGGYVEWDWIEAFCKFGFKDGDGQVETWQVSEKLEEHGYSVNVVHWGCHNIVITSIKKDGVEFMPDKNSGYIIGYTCPRDYLPDDIIKLLDDEFPTSTDYQF